ncbi:hypothetical protein [Microlunatus soli]|uniref:hypothetical protein n=1 Tax=Microlunatus soli TaxID=630515 RepID=UPI0012FA094C|nr:hypothetical protein [Microlunatus soli]
MAMLGAGETSIDPGIQLRLQVRPGATTAGRARRWGDYCRQRRARGVVLFIAAEERYPGHPQPTERADWLQALAVATEELRSFDLQVGFNPWSSVGPWDLGRANRLGFEPMVSASGRRAEQQASFACPVWLQWITDWYGDLAALRPDVFWLEDDFRLHNHAPVDFGGFEEIMLDRFRDAIGERPSREQIVAAILSPGAPHPWRAALQLTWREAQLDAAAAIGHAVATRSGGNTRMGLMSSVPAQHAVEGRDWHRLFDALGPGTLHRPHFAGYSESTPSRVSTELALLDQQRPLRPPGTPVTPEIDNWPHTRWSKSHTETWSQLALAKLSGADGLLLCLFSFYGDEPDDTPDIDTLLDATHPALTWLAERCDGRRRRRGVRVIWDPAVSTRQWLRKEATWPDLVVDPTPVAAYLLRNGVPVSADDDGPGFLFGAVSDALTDDELLGLLSGPLLVDGDAAVRLTRRGFGDLLGVRILDSVPRLSASDSPYALERLTADGQAATGLPGDTVTSVNHQPGLTRLAVDGGACWTDIRTPIDELWGAGRIASVNRLGGRIVVTAAHAVAELPASDTERTLLQSAVRFALGDNDPWPTVTGGPHLAPVIMDTECRSGGDDDCDLLIAVVNGSGDPETVSLSDVPERPVDGWLLAPMARPRKIGLDRTPDGLQVTEPIPSRSILVIEPVDRPAKEARADGQPT